MAFLTDVQPENILLASKDPNSDVKIADFGLSKIMEATTILQTACGTPGYVGMILVLSSAYMI